MAQDARGRGRTVIGRTFDEETGIISVTGTGLWSYADIEQHYVELRAIIAGLRARSHPVRILSDVTSGERQAAWVEDYILEQMRVTYESGDRIALLAGSEGDRLHLHERADYANIASFTSRAEAIDWLTRGETAPEG